jgi:hypothetical protein
MRAQTAGLLLVAALTACGSPAYDEQVHRADVEQTRGPVTDWPKLRDNMRALCHSPAELFAFAVSANQAADVDIDVHLRHLCPERLDEAQAVRGTR